MVVLIVILGASFSVSAQTLRDRLNQPTDYRVRAAEPSEQLVEVAKHFKMTIGIEWYDAGEEKLAESNFTKGTVLDLIKAIVARAPHEQVIVEDRIVRVFPTEVLNHKLNFLNLRLEHYCVSDECVLGANFDIKIGIDRMLYPEKFKHGYGGGYGGGEWLLWIKSINICVENATLRELFNEIVSQSGQAGWMARIKPDELQGQKPFWIGVPMNEHGTSPITGHWWFFELQ